MKNVRYLYGYDIKNIKIECMVLNEFLFLMYESCVLGLFFFWEFIDIVSFCIFE